MNRKRKTLETVFGSTENNRSLGAKCAPQKQDYSCLIIRAFILDTHIKHPDRVVIAVKEREVLLSEVFAFAPSLRQQMIDERVQVFRQLGWDNERGV